jgi:DNA recombination protein RmuC
MGILFSLALLLSIFFFFRGEKFRERAKRLFETEQELREMREELVGLKIKRSEQNAYMTEQKRLSEEKLIMIKESQDRLTQAFQALSSEALEKSNRSFLNLAEQTLAKFQEKAKGDLDKKHQSFEALVKPVQTSLTRLDQGMREMEKERKGDQESLKAQMSAMLQLEKELRLETSTLVKALRAPTVRGRWGEMQLKRVVELAGMVNHCDFYEQESSAEGSMRPDVIIRLPGHKQVIVDAKTPCEAFLEAMQSEDQDLKIEKLKMHARHVRHHIQALGKKSYWQSFQPTPEFVVLFIPSDHFFSSALEYDPTLIEIGVEQGVIIATPTTLIGLLRAIAYGWKQEKLSQHAEEVSRLGHELYKRIVDMNHHWIRVGRSLGSAVESYNKAVGSLESRVLVSARKFKDLGAASAGAEIDELSPIDRIPREIQAIDMKES